MYAVLRTLKWKPVTQHFKAHYLPISTDGVLQIYYGNGVYGLLNTQTSEWAKAPLFVVNTLTGNNSGDERGPFIFKNGFEQEDEAHYLVSMLQYSTLSTHAQQKVDDILRKYGDWITYDTEVRDYLKVHIGWL